MSLRHRLPLTYGLIALLAALALGAALLLILRDYYGRQETDYLERNAVVISELLTGTSLEDVAVLERQMQPLAFLTQMRIRVFDSADNLLVDTGLRDELDVHLSMSLIVEGDGISQAFSHIIEGEEQQMFAHSETDITVEFEEGGMRVTSSTQGGSTGDTIATPWNFNFNTTADAHSNAIVRAAFPGILRQYGGYVELSEGPAFGRTIIRNVAWGLLAAGTLAVVLATGVGVLIARRITRPLLDLTVTTEQLHSGNLAVRSQIYRADEIGRLSTTFNAMAARVEHTVATLRHFVADAAHEINTPLTALHTNLELAAQQPNDPSHLQHAQAQTERLTHLTSDLLQLSRLESDELPPVRLPLDLGRSLATWCEPFASQGEQQEIAFNLSLPDERICVDADAGQLRRAVGNLLDNALKFTQAGGDVLVRLEEVGNSAEITIRDTGIGFDGDPDRIFDRFHRAPNAASYAGSGLGLAIVQHIVEAHSGTLAAANHPHGATLTVRLPIATTT